MSCTGKRIYVVLDADATKFKRTLVAAFTVKHELVSWLKPQKSHAAFEDWYVYVSGDGTAQEAGNTAELWISDLLQEGGE